MPFYYDDKKCLFCIKIISIIDKKKKFKLSPRILSYSIAMLILLASSIAIVSTRQSVEVNILRVSGTTYIENSGGMVSNMFNLSLVNKTFEDKKFILKLKPSSKTKGASILMIQNDSLLQGNSELKKVFMIQNNYQN